MEKTSKASWEIAQDKLAYEHWLETMTQAKDEDRVYALRMLAYAIEHELTDLQRSYMTEYYANKLTESEIAEAHGVDISTVSRTLQRARQNLHHVLKYCHPRFLISQPEAVREHKYNRRSK